MSTTRPRLSITGFTVQKSGTTSSARAVAPPPSLLTPSPSNSVFSKQGYSTLNSINHNAISTAAWGMPKKRTKTEDEYFEEDDDTESNSLEYIPAPGSPSYKVSAAASGAAATACQESDDDEEEEDPLDAFMASIEKQMKTEANASSSNNSSSSNRKNSIVRTVEEKSKNIRDDIEKEDDEESYYKYMEENPRAGLQEEEESENEVEYDEDGNPIVVKKPKIIDPLPSIDHSTINYEPFEKNFYNIHEEISRLTKEQAKTLKESLGIKVTGVDAPSPVTSFAHFGFDELLMKMIRKCEYTQPTPIQAQAIPAALSGRDVLGIAKTGSGKTAAFIWPMLVHIMDQKELQSGDGPIGIILAPTRELSLQIYNEAKKFGKVYNINVICCYGGGSKWEQSKSLESGAEIVVATPGRLIDLVKMKATNLTRVTFVVLDEADRMFDMGFEPQVRSICDHTRPDRQTLLFSATFKKKVERLARDVLNDPIRIVQGDIGEANADVTQIVCVMNQVAKLPWLQRNFVYFLSIGSVLIFVTKKLQAEELANTLTVKEYDVLLLHGDMDQSERNKVIMKFKKQEVNILIATDVAARGLDIPHIRTVVNYDVARDIDTHTHRIGRTGRAGEKGTAYTLVTDKDKDFAGHLVRNLESVNQDVPTALLDLAAQNPWFRKTRFKGGKGKSVNIGGTGLGYKERPGHFFQQNTVLSGIEGVARTSQKTGPGSERLAALKAAFKTQYQSQFTSSEDRPASEQNNTKIQYGLQFAKPASVVTELSNSGANTNNSSTSTTTTAAMVDNKKVKRKSRWDSN